MFIYFLINIIKGIIRVKVFVNVKVIVKVSVSLPPSPLFKGHNALLSFWDCQKSKFFL